ncbi:MAG: succinate dehydrogenase, cytochrome b556 subunit [Methylococcales bacterium]|nr:succinate dehydrogenase, cytochrome b556 subunit [Methylococcales bacterium]
MTKHKRPLSPHLQVYRLPLTGLISITHRITGVFLSLGLLLCVYLFVAIAAGEAQYNNMQVFMAQPLCRLVYWGFIFALFFHLSHGVRHLLWDMGGTFERTMLNRYAIYELIATVLLFLIAFIIL